MTMVLLDLGREFAVCQLAGLGGVDLDAPYTFLARTDDELSLVCEAGRVPDGALKVERGWRGLKIRGELDFGLIGIIAKIATALAEAGIAVFVVSTYNTDYVLVKADRFDEAKDALRGAGHDVTP